MISFREEETKKRKAREDRRRREEREEAGRLYEAVEAVIDKYEDDVDISPAWVAIEGCRRLNGFEISRTTDFYVGTNLYLRQIARQMCRKKWEENEDDDDQHPLFPDLQKRYPIARTEGEEPLYRRLEQLTDEDIAYNLRRMDAEIASKQKHREALYAYSLGRKNAA
jgi:hypothetical protein